MGEFWIEDPNKCWICEDPTEYVDVIGMPWCLRCFDGTDSVDPD